MFDICVIIHGVFETPPTVYDPHDPEEVLDLAMVLAKPSMFCFANWEIIDRRTGTVLVSWDSDHATQTVSQVIWDSLRGNYTNLPQELQGFLKDWDFV